MPRVNEILKVEKKEGIEIKGLTVKCEFPDDCNFPICICSEPEPTKDIYVSTYNRGYNKGQEDYGNREIGLDVGKIKNVILGVSDNIAWYDIDFKPITKEEAIAQALKAQEGEIIVEIK